jgi:WD40 repeat protein
MRHGGDYMYSYYVPPSAGTPWRPVWSPDGKELAFSMAGSIWKIRIGETVAHELTAHRTNDSSPAWSPDGRWIAYTAEDERGVNLMLLKTATGESAPLTSGGDLNLDPAWSPDGKRLAFVRNQPAGQFHVYVMPIENGSAGDALRITEPNNFGHARLYFHAFDDHIQPAWSPDGKELMLVSNRGSSLGSGAIWRARAEPDCMRGAKMILREETLYRTEPQWSPDGKRILYSSHRGNQYDNLYLLPAEGGEPYQLTHGDWDHFDARWSPDGEWIAYISNEHGVSDLRLLRVAGGDERKVEIRQRQYRRPMGKLEVHASDPARFYLVASDGKTYVPDAAYQRVPHGAGHGDFFHAGRHFMVELPAGETILEAVKGIEWEPVVKRVVIKPGEITPVEITMQPMVRMSESGWYSGTDHTHMNYCGNLHNTPENMMFMADAEDLNVVAAKIANKDNRILDWQYFTGEPHPLSTAARILRFDEEYRPPFYGHINVINLRKHLISPFTTGYEQTALASLYPSNTDIFQAAREEGGIGGYVHPWSGDPVRAGYGGARVRHGPGAGFIRLPGGAYARRTFHEHREGLASRAQLWLQDHRVGGRGFHSGDARDSDTGAEPRVCLSRIGPELGRVGGWHPARTDVRH